MKQALYKKGIVYPVVIPEPSVKRGYIKIRVLYSCISAGTEVGGVKSSGKSIIRRAIEAPNKVAGAINYLKLKGLGQTLKKIHSISEKYKSSGYSVAGIVEDIGDGVSEFKTGDRVVGSGAGYAVHSEFVIVPAQLVTKIPDEVPADLASVSTVGAIALQGVRRADLKIGEFAVVYGCGLIGLLTVQILNACGLRIAAIDLNDNRLGLALNCGAEITINPELEDASGAISNWSGGYGADAVLFTASTNTSEPLNQAFTMTRKKGKVIMVGVSGMCIDREEMYKKEIDFLISTSYGPGRYDDRYELEGTDYPYAYVRWTEGRNISEFLRLLKNKLVDPYKIGLKKYPIDEVGTAFKDLEINSDNCILSLIEYAEDNPAERKTFIEIQHKIPVYKGKIVTVGLIGAGSFAVNRHLPILTQLNDKFYLKSIVSRNGKQAWEVATTFNASSASTEINSILQDEEIDLVLICTRHDNHAELVQKALKSNKNVFVEKPLATSLEQLEEIKNLYLHSVKDLPLLMVGFNRRFSNYLIEIKTHTDRRINPLFIRYRMNAGFAPKDSWVHKDGGRIVGEACHIIDLIGYLTNSTIREYTVTNLGTGSGKFQNSDNISISLSYHDGSVAVIDYFAIGNPAFPKESLEIHFDNKTLLLDDYKSLKGFGLKIKNLSSKISDKGHYNEWLALYKSLTTKEANWPISFDDLINTTTMSILAASHHS